MKKLYKLLYVLDVITENSGSKKKTSDLCLGHYKDLANFMEEIDSIELINSLDYEGGFIWRSRPNSQIIETLKLQRFCTETNTYQDFCKKKYPMLYTKTKSFKKLDKLFKAETKEHLGQAVQNSGKSKQFMIEFELGIEEDNSIRLPSQFDNFILGYYDSVDDAVAYLERLFKNLSELLYCGDYRWETIKSNHTEHTFTILEFDNETGEYCYMESNLSDRKMENRLRSISW